MNRDNDEQKGCRPKWTASFFVNSFLAAISTQPILYNIERALDSTNYQRHRANTKSTTAQPLFTRRDGQFGRSPDGVSKQIIRQQPGITLTGLPTLSGEPGTGRRSEISQAFQARFIIPNHCRGHGPPTGFAHKKSPR